MDVECKEEDMASSCTRRSGRTTPRQEPELNGLDIPVVEPFSTRSPSIDRGYWEQRCVGGFLVCADSLD
jgi:hypothetical protein